MRYQNTIGFELFVMEYFLCDITNFESAEAID